MIVTSFDDDGAGTLRDALRTAGAPRVITFAGSGVIALATPLLVPANVSVDGAGVDVTLQGRGFVVADVHDVILTHLTVADTGPDSEDGAQILRSHDVVLDHVTFVQTGAAHDGSSASVDEAVSVVLGASAVTIQHCRFEAWEKALLFGNGDVGVDVDGHLTVTVFGNVFASTGRRHPQARFGSFDVTNNLLFDWHFFRSPFIDPWPESFGAQVQDGGRLRFENNVVSRIPHRYDDVPLLSQAHDVTRCESGGLLDERGTFVRADNEDPALAFGVDCPSGVVVSRPYALDVAAADEALAVRLLASAGNLP